MTGPGLPSGCCGQSRANFCCMGPRGRGRPWQLLCSSLARLPGLFKDEVLEKGCCPRRPAVRASEAILDNR